jgi:hypothetical protein
LQFVLINADSPPKPNARQQALGNPPPRSAIIDAQDFGSFIELQQHGKIKAPADAGRRERVEKTERQKPKKG